MTHSKINDMGEGNNIIFTVSSILKNCKIYFYGNNIVGAGAIVTHSIKRIQNTILAGIPARIVKKDAN